MRTEIKATSQLSRKKHPAFAVDSYPSGLCMRRINNSTARPLEFMASPPFIDDYRYIQCLRKNSFRTLSTPEEINDALLKINSRYDILKTEFYLGVYGDPFHPFDKKFQITKTFLEKLKKFSPRLIHIYTRSQLIVLLLPILSVLKRSLRITIGIETCLEESVKRYTPYLPSYKDRIKLCRTLRKFGIKTSIQIDPILPYGDLYKDASTFARILIDNCDYIKIPAVKGIFPRTYNPVKCSPIYKKLLNDGKYEYLSNQTHKPLTAEIAKIKPEILTIPPVQGFEQPLLFESSNNTLC